MFVKQEYDLEFMFFLIEVLVDLDGWVMVEEFLCCLFLFDFEYFVFWICIMFFEDFDVVEIGENMG